MSKFLMTHCDFCVGGDCESCTSNNLTEHDKEIIAKIRNVAIDELIEIVGALESCCIDHEENEIGEWLTFTFDYGKWADMLHNLEQLKEK